MCERSLDAGHLEQRDEAAEAVLREAPLCKGGEVDLALLDRAALVSGHHLLDLPRHLLDNVEESLDDGEVKVALGLERKGGEGRGGERGAWWGRAKRCWVEALA